MNSFKKIYLLLHIASFLLSCSEKELVGFTGPFEVVNGDTIRFTIPKYELYNQDSVLTTNKDLKGKIHVMAFFFTSCPGTCPVITGNLLALHQKFKDNENVHIVSVSIDPNNDTFARLKEYANGYGIDTKSWSFLRGDEAYTHDFMEQRLYQSVVKDKNVPGGFDHSSNVLLVDKEGRLRSFYEGTDKSQIDVLIKDVASLLENE